MQHLLAVFEIQFCDFDLNIDMLAALRHDCVQQISENWKNFLNRKFNTNR